MRLSREAKFGGWLLLALLIGAGAYLAGRSLKPQEDPHYVFSQQAPAYDAAPALAAISQAGFSGFGEVDGSDSRTVIAGRVVEKTGDGLVLEAPGGLRTPLRLGSSPPVSRVEEATFADLKPGMTVMVRLEGDPPAVQAVLITGQP